MATIEQVEKLREKANVTYDEAKAALEACGDDLLDAVIYLERQGKVKPPQNGGYYNSRHAEQGKEAVNSNASGGGAHQGETFSSLAGRFFKWCGRMIVKGNQNSFEVRQRDNVVLTVPVTILVVLLLLAFWVVVPLIIVGLFFNFSYRFRGPDLEKSNVNNVMGSAAEAAEKFKQEVIGGGSRN